MTMIPQVEIDTVLQLRNRIVASYRGLDFDKIHLVTALSMIIEETDQILGDLSVSKALVRMLTIRIENGHLVKKVIN